MHSDLHMKMKSMILTLDEHRMVETGAHMTMKVTFSISEFINFHLSKPNTNIPSFFDTLFTCSLKL